MSSGEHNNQEPFDELVDLIERSGFFDSTYYGVQRPGLIGFPTLARHYLEDGWREGLNPSPMFDTRSYLAVNHDVRASGMNPLVHFLRFGKAEGRAPLGAGPEIKHASIVRATAPSQADWMALPRRHQAKAPSVDVIVPVYRGRSETLRCIYSVLASPVATPFDLWVIDDASPEPELVDALRELASSGRISLFRNSHNRGFVGTCNFAMKMDPTRDVVLLNADTEVFPGWLDRLRAASMLPNVGTVTPFSNNAEICSYPRFLQNNDRHLELPDAELDAIMAEVNRGDCVDLPTAVGFCVYVKRACLNTVGYFDEANFGHGYGEENDFCQRASRLGWRNVLATDVFVRHYGGISFESSKPGRVHAAGQVLARLHPGYHEAVRRFILADPARPFRQRVDAARIRRYSGNRTFLFVTHNRGGGTELHVNQLAERIAADGAGVVFCRAEEEHDGQRLRFSAPGLDLPNLAAIDMSADIDDFVSASTAISVVHLHIHHLAGFPEIAVEFFREAAKRLAVGYDVTIHDYMFACPRITMIDASGYYCGEPNEDGCTRCLARAGSEFGAQPIWLWRARHERLLNDARAVFVPDIDIVLRLRRYFPSAPYVLRPHPDVHVAPVAPAADPIPVPTFVNGVVARRIGLIGAIGPHKGSRLLLECARIVRDCEVPITFCVLGYTDIDAQLRELGVSISGAYRDDELVSRIVEAGFDIAWFASVWPETYCYTLSAALRAGAFPVAFDIGAIAGRLRSMRWGHLMPIEAFFDPKRVVNELAGLPTSPFPAQTADCYVLAESSFINQYYDLPPLPARWPEAEPKPV